MPNNWKTYKLSDIADITSSKRIFLADYVDKGIPFYRSKEIIEKANGLEISSNLFIDEDKYFDIKKKFGKNAILKGMNLLDGATAKERNEQIGGHKA